MADRTPAPAAPALLALLGILPALSAGAPADGRAEPGRGARLMSQVPPLFVENRGQAPAAADFVVTGKERSLSFGAGAMEVTLYPRLSSTGSRAPKVHRVGVEFAGARAVRPMGIERQVTQLSWLRGRPEEWITGVPAFGGVRYREPWPGIDAEYRGEPGCVKGQYIVAPGADPSLVRLRIRGAIRLRVESEGTLRVETPSGVLSDPPPVAYQEVEGARRPVECAYDLRGETCGFRLGAYDRTHPLVIDPVTVISCGYFGSFRGDVIQDVATDAEGNCYVGGLAGAPWLGQDIHSRDIDPTLNDETGDPYECFVGKISADGSRYLYGAVFGGDGEDFVNAITVDSRGRICATGYTNSVRGFPAIMGPFLTQGYGSTPGSVGDAFVARFNAAGTHLEYCGYLGGSGRDTGLGIAAIGDTVYVAGTTFSSQATFPVRDNPWGGGLDLTYDGQGDGFVCRLWDDGTDILWCKYLGGPAPDSVLALAVSGFDLQAVGVTQSDAGSFHAATPQGLHPAGSGFVAALEAVGGGTRAFGFLAGNCRDVAISGDGRTYVTGTADGFPDGQEDSFVARLQPGNFGVDWFRTFGGSDRDVAHGIGVDTLGVASVVGWTRTRDGTFPVGEGPADEHAGSVDVFVTRFSADGTQMLSSGFIGSADQDRVANAFGHPLISVSWMGPGTAAAVTPDGDVWVGGTTGAIEGLPLRAGPFLQSWGPDDGFLARVGPPTPLAPVDVFAGPEPGPRIRVSWLPGDPLFERFEVERAALGQGFARVAELPGTGRQWLDGTVEPGCTYLYRVRALLGQRVSSYSGEAATCAYPLEAPVLLEVATVAADAFSIVWEDRSTREDGFELERSTDGTNFALIYAQGDEPGAGYRMNHTDAGLLAGTTYHYRVRATLGQHFSAYSDVFSSVAGPLGAPTGLTATSESPIAVRLGWTDNAVNESGFRVERAEVPAGSAPGDFEVIDTVAAKPGLRSAVSYTDGTVNPGTAYQYRVRAYRGAETSAYSNAASVESQALPAAPSGLVATRVGPREIRVTFQDNAAGEDGFVLEAGPTHLKATRRAALLPASPDTGGAVSHTVVPGRAPLVWRTATYRFRAAAFRRLSRSRLLFGPFTEWVVETPPSAPGRR